MRAEREVEKDPPFGREYCLADPRTGVATGVTPWPQYAFKMSMFNVSCNSH